MNPMSEYLSGGVLLNHLVGGLGSTLAFTNDDVVRDLGYRVYEEMINDPQVHKSIEVLKIGTLGNDLELLPSLSEESADYKKSLKMLEFCQFLVDSLEFPLKTTLNQMMDALIYGHKLAEIVYAVDSFNGKAVIMPKKLKVKPLGSFNFVVDGKMNLLGIASSTSSFTSKDEGAKSPIVKKVGEGYIIKLGGREEKFLARNKFMLLSLRGRDEDPRGRSFLRPAFNAWHLKTQIYPEYLRFLLTCSIPLLVGFTPETDDGRPLLYRDESTGNTVEVNPVQALRDALLQARNATALALRGGSSIQEIGSKNSGVAFYKALEILDEQIDKAILLQTLATSESRYQSRAASMIHMSVLEQLVWDLKTTVLNMLRQDLFEPAIKFNFGEQFIKYMPKISLGDTERRDFASDATAVATLFKAGYITNDQMKALDAMLGVPIRGNEKVDSAAQIDMITNKISMLATAKAALINVGGDTKILDEVLESTMGLLRDVIQGSSNSEKSASTGDED